MRVVFMGTPDFAVGTLEALVKAGHEVVLAVTQPDKPKGRGKAMQPTPVKEAAEAHGIPVYQPVKIREASCVDYLAHLSAGRHRGGGFRTDPAEVHSGNAAIRLRQRPCLPAAQIPGRGRPSSGRSSTGKKKLA